MSHSRLCRSAQCRIRHNVTFGIMSHSVLCRIRTYVVRDCVVRRNVVRPTIGVSKFCVQMKTLPVAASAPSYFSSGPEEEVGLVPFRTRLVIYLIVNMILDTVLIN